MREDDRIRTTKMAEAVSENRNRDLWSEVRRIKGRTNSCLQVLMVWWVMKMHFQKTKL